eukprot:1511445-Rhodomonas_salina.2
METAVRRLAGDPVSCSDEQQETIPEPQEHRPALTSATTEEIPPKEETVGIALSNNPKDAGNKQQWHGCILPAHLPLPRCVAKTNLEARPGHAAINASEYLDSEGPRRMSSYF